MSPPLIRLEGRTWGAWSDVVLVSNSWSGVRYSHLAFTERVLPAHLRLPLNQDLITGCTGYFITVGLCVFLQLFSKISF